MSFRKTLSIQLGVAGVFVGAVSGFVMRDEYYFPSYKRIDELAKEFYHNEELIDKEITELNTRLKTIQLKTNVSPNPVSKPKAPEVVTKNSTKKTES